MCKRLKCVKKICCWVSFSLPSSWCQWPLTKGIVDIELHRLLCCQKPPPRHHLETATIKRRCYKKRFKLNHHPSQRNLNVSHLSNQHLVYENSEPPPIHRPRVRRVRQNLWSQKLRGATERTGPISKSHAWRPKNKTSVTSSDPPKSNEHAFGISKSLPSLHNPKSAIFT